MRGDMASKEEVLAKFDSEGMAYAILNGYADDCEDAEIAALVEQVRGPLSKLQKIFMDDFVYG